MNDIFDKILHHFGSAKESLFVINIGAMDGVMFDDLSGYVSMYNMKGLYVEPIPYLYEKLKTNLSKEGNLFENSAISNYDGTIKMMTINRNAIDNSMVHPCFYGMSSIYPPRNGLASEGDRQTVQSYGELIDVNCITFNTLVKKHNITNIDVISIDAEGHDYEIFKQIDLSIFRPKLIRCEWCNLSDDEQKSLITKLENANYIYEIIGQNIDASPKEIIAQITSPEPLNPVEVTKVTNAPTKKVTIVTGLWDIKRGSLTEDWSRSFEHYLNNFTNLMKIDNNMIIFIEEKYKSFVLQHRSYHNTVIVTRETEWFRNNEYFNKIQKIRNNPDWYNQVGWLTESTQAKLEMYNPLVMSKVFLLNDARIMDSFNSDYLFWIDAGITNTVHAGYLTHDKVLDKIEKYINKFSFICFPYEANTEIHGFNYDKLNDIAGSKVTKVARGGFFGGPKETISNINTIYYNLLQSTLDQGYMGTEESLFTIMTYKHSDIIDYFEIESNGLVSTFFENLKNDTLKVKSESIVNIDNNLDINKVSLYVLTFNSPNQFKTLIESFKLYDNDYLIKPRKILLDNSTDINTYNEYKSLCEYYGFEHIKKDNLGICGGRQFIAEHFAKSDSDYMLFFEDDMFFSTSELVCKNGFGRKTNNLYTNSLQITKKENLDFLKLNFTEFYGDNSTQWAWYNVPQHIREKHWHDKTQLPVQGLDPNAPKTVFKYIKSHNTLPYAIGEVYYCNWPQIVSKTGNKKMFLDTTWAHPFEQTWMSHMFQMTIKDELKSGILLLTPTDHNRFEFYKAEQRKES
jgi:FkbM family methyltransferase